MNKVNLNSICFIVSIILFVIGVIITNGVLSTNSENLVRSLIGITYMLIGAGGFLVILSLFNKS